MSNAEFSRVSCPCLFRRVADVDAPGQAVAEQPRLPHAEGARAGRLHAAHWRDGDARAVRWDARQRGRVPRGDGGGGADGDGVRAARGDSVGGRLPLPAGVSIHSAPSEHMVGSALKHAAHRCPRSSQLLMLSGVGPPDVLAAHGIAPVAASWGVGRNLQDHLMTNVTVDVVDPRAAYAADPDTRYQCAGDASEPEHTCFRSAHPCCPGAPLIGTRRP